MKIQEPNLLNWIYNMKIDKKNYQTTKNKAKLPTTNFYCTEVFPGPVILLL